ncbi:Subtilisin-like protease SBT1.4, partial [Dichanthelium oligosanthes]
VARISGKLGHGSRRPPLRRVARDGFAVVRHGSTATDHAFARGLCFGTPVAGYLACLSAAVSCSRGAHSRRAGVWCHGCFLAYADTDAPSACEDAFRGWFYAAVQNTKVRPGGECMGDRVAADCGRCFEDSARAAAALGGCRGSAERSPPTLCTAAVAPTLASPRVHLLPARPVPHALAAPGAWGALLLRASRDWLRGAADGAPGRAPRVPALRARRRPGRDAAAAHHPDAVVPRPLGVGRAPPSVERRFGRCDRRHRQRRLYPKDHASFAAHPSLPPPPNTFRGRCVSAPSFNASAYCNNKLIGAKFFYKGYGARYGPIDEATKSPLDTNGHGTHTATTAAGSVVADASFFDYAKGKAVGMATGARIAAYKVLRKEGRMDSDVLAAFDETIKDRSTSSPSRSAPMVRCQSFTRTLAVGAFSAVSEGIVVSASAGNDGPGESTVKNSAPWFITVGASTINRRFSASVVLGNGETFTGASLYAETPLGEAKIPLVFSGDVGSQYCEAGKLNASMVSGKIVLCDANTRHREQGEAVRLAGGAGAVLAAIEEYGEQTLSAPHLLPATSVTYSDAIKRNASPVATISFHGTVVGQTPSSPRIASFSSRGPNLHAPEILKPDITAPGVDILAAWTGESSPLGHVDPNRALDPGFVYDAGAEDYVCFLRALGYTSKQIAIFTRDGSTTDCSKRKASVGDLNYPAFSVVFNPDKKAVTQRRVVRDLGSDVWTIYWASVTSPAGVRVTVRPRTLVFTSWGRTQGERDGQVHVRVHRVERRQAQSDEPHRHHLAGEPTRPSGGNVM